MYENTKKDVVFSKAQHPYVLGTIFPKTNNLPLSSTHREKACAASMLSNYFKQTVIMACT